MTTKSQSRRRSRSDPSSLEARAPIAAGNPPLEALAEHNYRALTLRDVLDARDHYHVHLAALRGVVGTAVGRYRIRKDSWFAKNPPGTTPRKGYARPTGERRLDNSVVTDWSWPAVLVFVDEWAEKHEFADAPDEMVPRALYLPDGRIVPTCVIKVDRLQEAPAHTSQPSFPKSYVGGGYLVGADVQGKEHLGSVGCLVAANGLTFALTNRHVTGEAGREIFSVFRGKHARVGVSAPHALGKKPFSTVYPGWPGRDTYCNLDAGLIRVDDVSRWTSRIVSLGALDEPLDFHTHSASLEVIGKPVRAFGAMSGKLAGKVAGLFYRYKSLGGFDHVADFLIGPDEEAKDVVQQGHFTVPGDSGTLWCLVEGDKLRPLALQWGKQTETLGGLAVNYAMATNLSSILRELDVDLLRSHNADLPETWGDIGHYTIGAKAPLALSTPGLSKLMNANIDRISWSDADITPKKMKGLSKAAFVPLADVPDKVWKMGPRRNPERPNHFADVDSPLPEGHANEGKTMLELCTSTSEVDVVRWTEYYTAVKAKSHGCLPFRVWQLYQAMVDAASQGDALRFVAAAGIVAHYMGDACQPLHCSYMSDGDSEESKGVHEGYESKLLNAHVPDIVSALNAKVKKGQAKPRSLTGQEAGFEALKLMQRSFNRLAPRRIIDAFVGRRDSMWSELGDDTIALLVDGSQSLAMLWESAWKAGNGEKNVPASRLVAQDTLKLAALYEDDDFLPSRTLGNISSVLK